MSSQTFKYSITISKKAANRVESEKLYKQVEHVKLRAFNASRVKAGWKGRISDDNLEKPKKTAEGYTYFARFSVTCKPARARQPDVVEAQWQEIKLTIESSAKINGWEVTGQDGKKVKQKEVAFAEAKIPEDWKSHFEHLYERDDQISIVLSALQAGISTDFDDRYHVCLVGPPAGGKTEILRAVRTLLGNDAVLEYDATATTQAGAIKDLDSRAEIPRVLLIEELEKVDENSLRWLLGVLDHRAEIRKTNFKVNIHKSVKMLCISTVNNYDLFLDMMSGALASRFPNHIYCPRPNRRILEQILIREVARVKGRTKWIKPTLDYAEKNRITDPRKVISICLCGRNDLLTGDYQAKLDRTSISKFHKKTRLKLKKESRDE